MVFLNVLQMKSKNHTKNNNSIPLFLIFIVIITLSIAVVYLLDCVCNANTLEPNFEQLKTEYQNQ